jgi:hypothetical protein
MLNQALPENRIMTDQNSKPERKSGRRFTQQSQADFSGKQPACNRVNAICAVTQYKQILSINRYTV